MKKAFVLIAALVLLGGGVAQGGVITAISVDTVPTSYDAGTGFLSMSGSGETITVDYQAQPSVDYVDGSFALITGLQTDTSSGGLVSGIFTGGSFVFSDSGGGVLFQADIIQIQVTEAFDGSGFITGNGSFDNTSGSLEAEWPSPDAGSFFHITFCLDPANPSSLGNDLVGLTDATITPLELPPFFVPEPASLILFALGATLVAARKRARHSA